MNKEKIVRNFVIGVFVLLYVWVSLVSTIHVIDFFKLTNPTWLAIALAVAFEIGAAASLAAIIVLDRTNKTLVWFLFILLTCMQMMGNMYYAYVNAHDYASWMELFALNEEEPIFQKRILAIVAGAILPIVALGFIKSLVDYVKPENKVLTNNTPDANPEPETTQIEEIIEQSIEPTDETSNANPPEINKQKVSVNDVDGRPRNSTRQVPNRKENGNG